MIHYRRVPYILAALLGCLIAAQARADQCLHADDVARGQAQWSPCGEDRLRPTGQGSANMLTEPITTQNIPLVGTISIAPICDAGQAARLDSTGAVHCVDQSWHLLTQTYGGTMQLVKHLSKHECEFMRARALGEPATPKERAAAAKSKKEKDAELQRYEDAWNAWMKSHSCKANIYGWTSGSSYKDSGGTCYRGYDSPSGIYYGGITSAPSDESRKFDIKTAECFQ